ncbi:MAG: hypothetical protein RR715_13260, partial [Comamonas sp.]
RVSDQNSDSPWLFEQSAASAARVLRRVFKKRIFGDFLGASRKAQLSPKLLARRGDIPASEPRPTTESETST